MDKKYLYRKISLLRNRLDIHIKRFSPTEEKTSQYTYWNIFNQNSQQKLFEVDKKIQKLPTFGIICQDLPVAKKAPKMADICKSLTLGLSVSYIVTSASKKLVSANKSWYWYIKKLVSLFYQSLTDSQKFGLVTQCLPPVAEK